MSAKQILEDAIDADSKGWTELSHDLLFDLAVLGILVGWVDALFTILDASDTLLATAQAAESIAGWIDQITPTFLGDTSWADQLAGVSN